ncbi:VENN motif pre-toxin domain-containing protein (plasmid) [Pantoea dispersa]|uniref:VENN motif pre-toxin domain-containing protein n=1 Tax=Pantoea dispersa TaxID=59814 RepID=UPI001CA7B08D|nr:VENN motif pre-toxin domain-containing protein [Pantoea dispersa]
MASEHANDCISPIFDKEKEQKRLQTAQLIGEPGSQVADIARTQGQIEATEAGKKELAKNNINQPDADAPAAEKKAYQEALENSSDYKKAMALWGTGSDIQKGIQAATAAIQGLAGGNLAQAASGAAAPYLAEQIHKYTADNQAAKAMAHAVVGAVTSWAAGNSAAAGATGAVSGELMGQLIMHSMYPGKQVSDLQESDKQVISALSTLAAGLAGGVTGGSSASALAGAQAGKNAVENNALTIPAPPVPVPGVPVGPGDQVKQDADKKIASGLEGTIKDLGDALDKATQCSFGRACSSENGEEQNQPNIGKDFSDADKAELGGTGSGTPGGWEPQDEENARNNEAHSAANSKNLNAELTGKEIADGHAFEKHVIQQNEFANLGIKTKEQFAQHIENVVKNPTSVKELSGGRSAYWDQSTNTVVIRNPKPGDGGTAFRPVNGRAYFDSLR